MNLAVSRECKPIDGSSNTYIEPTKLLPKEVAKLIRCDSPPDKVFEARFSVKYSKPTSNKNVKRDLISYIIRPAICWSYSLNVILVKKSFNSFKGKSTKSLIDFSAIFT